MKQYIIYARAGSTQQIRKTTSIAYQIRRLQYHAKQNNLQIGETISEIASGTDEKRKAIKEVLSKLSNGLYQGVLCTDFHKLSRSYSLTAKLWQLIHEKDITIITPYQIYKNDTQSKLQMDLQTNLAEAESKHMSERIKRRLQAKKARRLAC